LFFAAAARSAQQLIKMILPHAYNYAFREFHPSAGGI
jgi:hypothetical protein